jgi:hypothetical protein
MSLLKSVLEGLKLRDCKCTKLREPPPVPYVPTKDEVQEEVAKLRNLEIKTTIEKDTTLNFPVWYKNGTREAFLMHVTAVLDAIKKCGHFLDYKKAEKVHEEAKKAVESARAGLSLLDGTGAKSRQFCKKKAKEAAEKALAKAQDSNSEAREAREAEEASKVNNNSMKAGFLEDLEKAKQAQSTAKGAMTAAASKMFTFYSTCFLLRASMRGTTLLASRWKGTRMSTYKVTLWKAQGECLPSHLTTASCFTFSLHFPSTLLSKKTTTSQMYLRSPSASTYASLYGV